MIADSFDLALLSPTNSSPTRFSDTAGKSNLVIDLIFLQCGLIELYQHTILSESQLSSDHVPLVIDIPICNEVIHSSKLVITPGSNQEKEFIKDVISSLNSLDTSNIESVNSLNRVVNQLGTIIKQMWSKNTKRLRISKHSKQWWSNLCSLALNNYRSSRSWDN